VSSQLTGVGTDEGSSGEYGANEWLVDELYEQFIADKNSVDKSWWPILVNYHPTVKDDAPPAEGAPSADSAPQAEVAEAATPVDAPAVAEAATPVSEPEPAPASASASASASEPAPVSAPSNPPTAPVAVIGSQPVARTTSIAAKPQPVPADAPVTAPQPVISRSSEPAVEEPKDVVSPLRGMAKSLASNMDASLSVPTATSVRTIPAKLLIDNRIVINNHMRRARGG
jgi:2-oxoglutarate dehydrogenase E1 component